MFQQTGQMISQGDSDSTENNFSRETETFLIHNESGTVPNTPLVRVCSMHYTTQQIFLK
jgi:hypothetical protein